MVVVLGIVLSYQLGPTRQRADAAQLPALDAPVSQLVAGEVETPAAGPTTTRSSVTPVDRQQIKSLLDAAARRHGVNPGLVMGVGWWESGWNQSALSSTGAVGIMQVEPYTAASAGPRLLHARVDIHQAAANIELGAAILKENLDRYQGNLVKALVAYYAGPSAVTDWAHLDPDAQRYVVGVYNLAVAFDRGQGPA